MPALSDRFSDALAYANRLHRGQRRKCGGSPYLSHLLAVAALVMEAGGDEETCIAALLHDAVEDQGGAPVAAAIRERFGDRVVEIVDVCTEERRAGWSWTDRKLAAIRRVSGANESVLLCCPPTSCIMFAPSSTLAG